MQYTTRLAHMIAHSAGVSILYDSETPCADLEKRIIHLPPHFEFFPDETELLSIILEECGHIRYTQEVPKEILDTIEQSFGKMGKDIFDVFNMLEDIRIRYVMANQYKGAFDIFQRHLLQFIDSLDPTTMEPHAVEGINQGFFQFTCELEDDYQDSLWSKVGTYNEDAWREAAQASSTIDLVNTDIFRRLVDLIPKRDPQDEQNKQDAVDKLKQMLSDAKKEMEAGQQEREQQKDINARAVEAACEEAEKKASLCEPKHESCKFSVDNHTIQAVKRPLDKLKEMNISRVIQNQSRGKLNARKLYKVAIGSNKVFKRMIMPDMKGDVALVILVDLSGSMRGENVKTALATSFAISKGLEGLNKKSTIIGYSNGVKVLKAVDERVNQNQLSNRAEDIVGGGTDESCALREAKKFFATQSNKRKVLITITDGDPDNKTEASELLRSMDCEQMAIGIRTSVDYYPVTRSIRDVQALPQALSELLIKTI